MKRFFILFCLGGLTFNSITFAAESNSCKRNILDTADKIPKYFLFASDSTGNGINKKLIDDLFLRYGSDVLVGADTSDENFSDILAAAKLHGMKRHVYLEGPGGTTGSSGWYDDEKNRIDSAAKQQGITIGWRKSGSRWWPKNGDKGYLAWRKTGWQNHTKAQIDEFRADGIYSVEIDNLYNDFSGDGPENIINLLTMFETWNSEQSNKVKLVLKNLNEEKWQVVLAAIREQKINRATLADFHLAEYDTGDRNLQFSLAKEIAIQTIFTGDNAAATNDYKIPRTPVDRGVYTVCPTN